MLVEPRDPPFGDVAAGLASPDPAAVGPDDLVLAATVDDTVRGYVWSRPAGDGARRVRVAVAPDAADGGLRAELARQAAAHGAADGAGRLVLDGDGEAFASADLDPVARDDGPPTVPLTGPAVAALTTPPGVSSDRTAAGAGADDAASGDPPSSGVADDQPPAGEAPSLRALLSPRRVAVVGATDREGAIGRLLLENLADYGGEVVPVTPRAEEVFGRPAPDSLADAGEVDLAVVAVPPDAALEAVDAAGECGVEAVVVVTAGFDEAGPEGEAYARRLRRLADVHDLTLVGPNSMGVMSTASGLNATFSPRHPPRGSVSLVSQSGAFVTATVAAAAERGLGFRHVVSVGNKAVVDEVDLLPALADDPGTDLVVAYLEDVARGEAFVEAARSVTRDTPVVVLKSGRTEAGAAAAASHTGSLAGDDTAVDAALARAGVVRADSAEELLDYADVLAGPAPAGDRVGIVTNAGGPGVLATDAADATGLPLADLAAETRERLADLLPPSASAANPVDVLGDADAERFADAADAVLADPGVDVVAVVTTPHPLVDYADVVAAVGRRALARDTPVVTCLMDGRLDADARRALRRYGVANYPDPSRAMDAVAAARTYRERRDRPPVARPAVDLDRERIRAVVEDALADGRDRLGVESLSLLEAAGVDVPDWGLARSPDEAGGIARDVGGPVALKVASPDLAHKADVGGVRVGVAPADAPAVHEALVAAVREAAPDAAVDGVVVQAMVDDADAVETVVGATDSAFGPLLAFGLGGTLVEHLDDVTFELAPVDHRTAGRMLDALDAADVLRGARDRRGVDADALRDALVRVSALCEVAPEIAELDVNPLVATPDGATAVDLQVEFGDEG